MTSAIASVRNLYARPKVSVSAEFYHKTKPFELSFKYHQGNTHPRHFDDSQVIQKPSFPNRECTVGVSFPLIDISLTIRRNWRELSVKLDR